MLWSTALGLRSSGLIPKPSDLCVMHSQLLCNCFDVLHIGQEMIHTRLMCFSQFEIFKFSFEGYMSQEPFLSNTFIHSLIKINIITITLSACITLVVSVSNLLPPRRMKPNKLPDHFSTQHLRMHKHTSWFQWVVPALKGE